jgi:hypothetical protein
MLAKEIKDMTQEEMLEELKTWDDKAWQKFKRDNYEVINLGPIPEQDDAS